jgi:hypothetical protein
LKLAPILANYLYREKKLNLAGIGTFSLDQNSRTQNERSSSEGISFTHDASTTEDEGLINYISKETGKMKSLASSDLNSYLEIARQFLNIGKPFQFEGIGTLVKHKNEQLEFTADHLLTDKVKETGIRELSATSISDEALTTYESLKPQVEKNNSYKKFFLAGLAVVTIAAIVFVSKRIYQKDTPVEQPLVNESVPVNDTTKYISPAADTVVANKQTTTTATINKTDYRFVIEVANRRRALSRYSILKKGNLPIQISTNDSVTYKLFFVLPATPADTARMADSLSTWYPALNKRKAFAEQ